MRTTILITILCLALPATGQTQTRNLRRTVAPPQRPLTTVSSVGHLWGRPLLRNPKRKWSKTHRRSPQYRRYSLFTQHADPHRAPGQRSASHYKARFQHVIGVTATVKQRGPRQGASVLIKRNGDALWARYNHATGTAVVRVEQTRRGKPVTQRRAVNLGSGLEGTGLLETLERAVWPHRLGTHLTRANRSKLRPGIPWAETRLPLSTP